MVLVIGRHHLQKFKCRQMIPRVADLLIPLLQKLLIITGKNQCKHLDVLLTKQTVKDRQKTRSLSHLMINNTKTMKENHDQKIAHHLIPSKARDKSLIHNCSKVLAFSNTEKAHNVKSKQNSLIWRRVLPLLSLCLSL